jgi:glycosyltransferase involved in cell wall biosynthesis
VVRVFGITTVRNAASTIRVCLLRHLSVGMERILVIDNGSTDATPTILKRMQRRYPVAVTRDERRPYRQGELMTGLLHEAARAGADWVVPFDDDEFLVSDEWLPDRLGYVQRDGILVPVVNFVQHESRRRDSPRALLTMTMRAKEPVEAARAAALARAGRASVVEAEWPRNLILRASTEVTLEVGSHSAEGIGPLELADWCRFLHAPLRSPASLRRSAEHGRRLHRRLSRDVNWQHFAMEAAAGAGRLDEQWLLNSWNGDARVGPERRPLVADESLAEAVRPFVRTPAKQLAARLLMRSY